MVNPNVILTITTHDGKEIAIPCEIELSFFESAFTDQPIDESSEEIEDLEYFFNENFEKSKCFYSTSLENLMNYKSIKLVKIK